MRKVFLDTNFVVYNRARTEPVKYQRAAELFLEVEAVVSTQVLSEIANVLSKKFSLEWSAIQEIISEVSSECEIVVVSQKTIMKALDLAKRYKYSYYDSLILAAAIEANCSILYSEDFQDGQVVEGVRIINPFH